LHSGTSRVRPFFGVSITPSETAWRTTTRPASRSTSTQRKPMSSPWRRPVRSATVIIARQSSSAPAINRSASSKVKKSNSPGGALSHLIGGTTESNRHSTAVESNFRNTVSIVDRLLRELGGELLGLVLLDLGQPDLIEPELAERRHQVHPQDLSLRDDFGALVVRDRVGRHELFGEGAEARGFGCRGSHAVVGSQELVANFVLELLGRTPRLNGRDLAHAAQPSVLAYHLNIDHPPLVLRAG
jgi:hypothetical protein